MAVGITSRLASFVLDTSFSDIPSEVIEKSKQRMLNSAGVALAASGLKEGQIITQYLQQIGGRPECTILGQDMRSSPVNAALANGTMAQLLDYDETMIRRGNRPSGCVFPVVMALGEKMALPGRAVVAAFAIGTEVSSKIGAAGDLDKLQPGMARLGWHSAAVPGTIGATAAAAKLLGLNQEQTENALGIGVGQTSGVDQSAGTAARP